MSPPPCLTGCPKGLVPDQEEHRSPEVPSHRTSVSTGPSPVTFLLYIGNILFQGCLRSQRFADFVFPWSPPGHWFLLSVLWVGRKPPKRTVFGSGWLPHRELRRVPSQNKGTKNKRCQDTGA